MSSIFLKSFAFTTFIYVHLKKSKPYSKVQKEVKTIQELTILAFCKHPLHISKKQIHDKWIHTISEPVF